MTNEKSSWFITYSKAGPGDPDGFFCSECFKREIKEDVTFLSEMTSRVNPENTPYYTCHSCNKDYRD